MMFCYWVCKRKRNFMLVIFLVCLYVFLVFTFFLLNCNEIEKHLWLRIRNRYWNVSLAGWAVVVIVVTVAVSVVMLFASRFSIFANEQTNTMIKYVQSNILFLSFFIVFLLLESCLFVGWFFLFVKTSALQSFSYMARSFEKLRPKRNENETFLEWNKLFQRWNRLFTDNYGAIEEICVKNWSERKKFCNPMQW